MNCLLMREISVPNTIRMWDTYLAEGADAFSQFHLYVCAAFLVQWSARLQEMDFQVCTRPRSHAWGGADAPARRGSSCSCSRCRRRTGRTRTSRCCSRARSCSARRGTTRRATSRSSGRMGITDMRAGCLCMAEDRKKTFGVLHSCCTWCMSASIPLPDCLSVSTTITTIRTRHQ
jgi:hypothetical protein